MGILSIIGTVLTVIIVLLVIAYFVKPELLILPYSLFIRLFVRNKPFPDMDTYFPEHGRLEENWEEIRSELIEVLKEAEAIPKFHEIDKIQKFISATDDIPWRTFGIKAFGNFVEPNASMVPKTREILEGMPNVTLALFSILDAGKHIPRHFGFFKGVLRYHLPLIVPESGECYIVCGKQRHDWEEGQGVIFDDTYWHEVWNNTEERRVVLFLDVARADTMPKWLRGLNWHMINLLGNSQRIKDGMNRAKVPAKA